jgi:hypothetical protein
MSTLIANTAVEAAIAAILMAIAALVAAAANWLNTRTRMMEQGLQIADLQRLTQHIQTVQQLQAAPSPPPAPTIVTVPTPLPMPAAPSDAPQQQAP